MMICDTLILKVHGGGYPGVFPFYFCLFFLLEATVRGSDIITLRSQVKGIQLMVLAVNQNPVNGTLISTT